MINLKQMEALLNKGASFDIAAMLNILQEETTDIDSFSEKAKGVVQSCLRKQYINEELILTVEGKEILSIIKDKDYVAKPKAKKVEKFDEWWAVYPTTDFFEYKGKVFKGTQNKRIKKEECKTLFNRLIAEGHSAEEIITATEFHFNTAKEISLKKGENQLTYIPNSERYLRIASFSPYIRLSKIHKDQKQNLTGVVDI